MNGNRVREQGDGVVFVVSAPSGAGKSTLVHRLMETVGGLSFSVSYTTRPRRPGEEDGEDYHFVTAERFVELRDTGGLLEWAEVHGQFYGTGKSAVQEFLASAGDVLLDLDVQGAEAVRRAFPDAILVFLLPPDYGELRRRLEGRGTAAAEVERRLATATQEVERVDLFDYVVVNDRLEEACGLLEAIVLAERSRRDRRRETWEAIAATFSSA
jgi:guanylate kinase